MIGRKKKERLVAGGTGTEAVGFEAINFKMGGRTGCSRFTENYKNGGGVRRIYRLSPKRRIGAQ